MVSSDNKRSAAKAITFRVVIIVADLVVVWLVTHRVDTTIWVTFWTNVSSTLLYYLHERAWNRVHWGRVDRAAGGPNA